MSPLDWGALLVVLLFLALPLLATLRQTGDSRQWWVNAGVLFADTGYLAWFFVTAAMTAGVILVTIHVAPVMG